MKLHGIWRAVFKYVLGTSSGRSWRETFVISFAVVVLAIPAGWTYVKPLELPMPSDGHAVSSFEIAVNRVYCKTTSHLGSAKLRSFIVGNGDILHEPTHRLPQLLSGSREAYCDTVTAPYLSNENSLAYMYTALMTLFDTITLSQIGFALGLVKIAGLVVFAVFLVKIGSSSIVAWLGFLIGMYVVHVVSLTHYYSMYPFFLPATVCFLSICGLALCSTIRCKLHYIVVLSIMLGFFGAGIINLRTSYIVVVYFTFILFVVFVSIDCLRDKVLNWWKTILFGVAIFLSFALGQTVFTKILIDPLTSLGTKYNFAHHAVGHPLVLGLAMPANELASAEGIKWDDSVGPDLARRIDPDVIYLGPTYEQALLTYYAKLWIFHTKEMVQLYTKKLRIAGMNGIAYLSSNIGNERSFGAGSSLLSTMERVLLWPMTLLPDGLYHMLTYALLGILPLVLWLRNQLSTGASYALVGMGGVAALLHLESTIIYPFFVATYHNFAMFSYYMFGLLCYQLIGIACVYAVKTTYSRIHKI